MKPIVLAAFSAFALAGAAAAQAASPANSAAPAATQPAAPHHTQLAAVGPAAGEHRDANDQAAVRMTRALNLLEAKGYGSFKDFRADGRNFDASVTTQGQPITVTINPDSGQVTRQG